MSESNETLQNSHAKSLATRREHRTSKKRSFLDALDKAFGNISAACLQCNIARRTYYRWLEDDPKFAEEVRIIEEGNIDYVESKLFEQIRHGNVTAQIFYLKTKGRSRGYIEGYEVDSHVTSNFNLSGLSDEELATMAAMLKKAK